MTEAETTDSTGNKQAAEGGKAPRKRRGPKSCVNCGRWEEVKRQMGIARILGNAVKQFEDKLVDEGSRRP